MNQPLVALASPDPSLTQAQSRHTQSELDTFPAQRRLWPDSLLGALVHFFHFAGRTDQHESVTVRRDFG